MITSVARFRVAAVAGAVATACAVLSPAAVSAESAIREYDPVPTPASGPCEVEFDRNGKLWIQEALSNKMARLDPETGHIEEFPLPTPMAMTAGMELGPDGAIWFPELIGNQIVRLDPETGHMREYPMPWGSVAPTVVRHGTALSDDLSFGDDGAAWFTLNGLNAIGRMDIKTGEMTKYDIPTNPAGPIIIQPGPKDAMVFSMAAGNKVGTIDVFTKQIREYEIPTPNSVPQGVATAPDGTIWFTETVGQKFGKIDPKTGKVTEFDLLAMREPDLTLGNPLPLPGPVRIGTDGKVYFTEAGLGPLLGNKINQFDPRSGKLISFVIPTPFASPCDLNDQRPGEIWFGEFVGNRVGVLRY